jgi:hypothetical protein
VLKVLLVRKVLRAIQAQQVRKVLLVLRVLSVLKVLLVLRVHKVFKVLLVLLDQIILWVLHRKVFMHLYDLAQTMSP